MESDTTNKEKQSNQLSLKYYCSNVLPFEDYFCIIDNDYEKKFCQYCVSKQKGALNITSVLKMKSTCSSLTQQQLKGQKERALQCSFGRRRVKTEQGSVCLLCGLSAASTLLQESGAECANQSPKSIRDLLFEADKVRLADKLNVHLLSAELFASFAIFYDQHYKFTEESIFFSDTASFSYLLSLCNLMEQPGFRLSLVFKAIDSVFSFSNILSLASYSQLENLESSLFKGEKHVFNVINLLNNAVLLPACTVEMNLDFLVCLSKEVRYSLITAFRGRLKAMEESKNTGMFASNSMEALKRVIKINNRFALEAANLLLLCLEPSQIKEIAVFVSSEIMTSFYTVINTPIVDKVENFIQLLFLMFKDNSSHFSQQEYNDIELMLCVSAICLSSKERNVYSQMLIINNNYSENEVEMQLEADSLKNLSSLRKAFTDHLLNKKRFSEFIKETEVLVESIIEDLKVKNQPFVEFKDLLHENNFLAFRDNHGTKLSKLSKQKKRSLVFHTKLVKTLFDLIELLLSDVQQREEPCSSLDLQVKVFNLLEALAEDCFETMLYVSMTALKLASRVPIDDTFSIFMRNLNKKASKLDSSLVKYLFDAPIRPPYAKNVGKGTLTPYFVKNESRLTSFIELAMTRLAQMADNLDQGVEFKQTMEEHIKNCFLGDTSVEEDSLRLALFFEHFDFAKRRADLGPQLLFSSYFSFKVQFDRLHKVADTSLSTAWPKASINLDSVTFDSVVNCPNIHPILRLNIAEFYFVNHLKKFEKKCNYNCLAKAFSIEIFDSNTYSPLVIEDLVQEEDSGTLKLELVNFFEDNTETLFLTYKQLFLSSLKTQTVSKACLSFLNFCNSTKSYLVMLRSIKRDISRVVLVEVVASFFQVYDYFIAYLKEAKASFRGSSTVVYVDHFTEVHTEDGVAVFRLISESGFAKLQSDIAEVRAELATKTYFEYATFLQLFAKLIQFSDQDFTPHCEGLMPSDFNDDSKVYDNTEMLLHLVGQLTEELFSKNCNYKRANLILTELIRLIKPRSPEDYYSVFLKVKKKIPILLNKLFFMTMQFINFVELDYYNPSNDVLHSLIIKILKFMKLLCSFNAQEPKEYFAELEIDYSVEIKLFDLDSISTSVQLTPFVLLSSMVESIVNYLNNPEGNLISDINRLKLAKIVKFCLRLKMEIMEGASNNVIQAFFTENTFAKYLKTENIEDTLTYLQVFQTGYVKDKTTFKLRKQFLKFFSSIASERKIKFEHLNYIFECITPEIALNLAIFLTKFMFAELELGNDLTAESVEKFNQLYNRDYDNKIVNREDFEIVFILFSYIKTISKAGMSRATNLLKSENSADQEAYYFIRFFNSICRSVEVNIQGRNKTQFFAKLPQRNLLLPSSRLEFLTDVDRENKLTKRKSIVEYSDFFKNEVQIVNEKIRKNPALFYLLKINFGIFNKFLFAFSIVVNIVLLLNLGKDEGELEFANYSLFVILALTQAGFACLFMIFWYLIRFDIFYSRAKITYSCRRNIKVDQLSFRTKLSLMIFDCFLFNVNFMTMAVMLVMAVISVTQVKLSWVFTLQLLLLPSISSNLYNIVEALRSKASQLLMSMVFTVILIFIYSLLTYSYLASDFLIEEFGTEFALCDTPAQCFASQFDYGMRMGGGIGDSMNILNWNTKDYWVRFGLSFSFFFLIILIMINVVSGIIIDTFSDLREKTDEAQADKENVCLVCGGNKVDIIKREGDFQTHLDKRHNVFNYMAFIQSIQEKDVDKLDEIDGHVLEKLNATDYSWFPSSFEKVEKEVKPEEEETEQLATAESKVEIEEAEFEGALDNQPPEDLFDEEEEEHSFSIREYADHMEDEVYIEVEEYWTDCLEKRRNK